MSKIRPTHYPLHRTIALPTDGASAQRPTRQVERIDPKGKVNFKALTKRVYSEMLVQQQGYMREKRIRLLGEQSALAQRSGITDAVLDKKTNEAHKNIKKLAQSISDYRRFRLTRPPGPQKMERKSKALKALGADDKYRDFDEKPIAQKRLLKQKADLLPMSYRGANQEPYHYQLPQGYALLSDGELPSDLRFFYNDRSGILMTPSGLKMLLMKKGDKIVVLFAGTEPGSFSKTGRRHTAKTDLVQRIGGYSRMYHDGAGVARYLLDSPSLAGKSFEFIGHSLGGGLAQHALTSNIDKYPERLKATTFNSAGLSPAILASNGEKRVATAMEHVENIRIEGDLVSPGSIKGSKLKGSLIGKVWTLKRSDARPAELKAHFSNFVIDELERSLMDSGQADPDLDRSLAEEVEWDLD